MIFCLEHGRVQKPAVNEPRELQKGSHKLECDIDDEVGNRDDPEDAAPDEREDGMHCKVRCLEIRKARCEMVGSYL